MKDADPAQPLRRSSSVKYMLLIHANPATVTGRSEAETMKVYAEIDAITKELSESGELIGGEVLADVSQSKVVRVTGGVPVTTDGRFGPSWTAADPRCEGGLRAGPPRCGPARALADAAGQLGSPRTNVRRSVTRRAGCSRAGK
jgi:hypothetical protein